jgi:predicted NBD/HSP70 family sugar kinase
MAAFDRSGPDFAADHVSLRRANLSLLLRSLRDRGPRSRARLAEDLHLNKATVSSLVAELAERGLVRDGRLERGGVGRPGHTVELDGRTVCGIGAEINVNHVATIALDLSGTVISERRASIDARQLDVGATIDALAALVAQTFDDVAARGGRPAGVTVGIAGLVDETRTLLTLAPNLGWRDLPLATMLSDRLASPPYPVVIDNEANLAAIAEVAQANAGRAESGRTNMLVIFGEVGVGGGIIADGQLLRGSRGYAGEFGHMTVDPQGRRCGCGRVGCWETVVGLHALLDAAADGDDPVRHPSLSLDERLAELTRRARLGDTRTLAAFDQVGGWVGTGAAALANVLNPEVIILSGYFAEVGPWMQAAIEPRLSAGVLAPRDGGTRVEFSTLGFNAATRGGAHVALDAIFTDPTLVARGAASLSGGAR